MKPRSILRIVLISAGLAFSQTPDAPAPESLAKVKIAVYVTGSVGADEKKALGTKILVELINSGRYRAVERSDDFVRELDREQSKQQSGAVDDNQITTIGKQFGVQIICVADLTPVFGSNQISARLIDVESAEIVAIADVANPLESMDDLAVASKEVVRVILGGKKSWIGSISPRHGRAKKANQYEPYGGYSQERDVRIRYGVGYAFSWLSSSKDSEFWGIGAELGFAASIPLFIDRLTVEPELTLGYKLGENPYRSYNNNGSDYEPSEYYNEYALSFPLVFRISTQPPPRTALYADVGIKWDFLLISDIEERKSTDFGFVWGVGVTWTRKKGNMGVSSFGYRNTINFTEITGTHDIGSLIQHSITGKTYF